MVSQFFVKWFLSLIVGSIWVVISTTVAEKVSGKLGGLIAGLPSTAVVGLLFIGLTLGIEAVQTASVILPLMSGLYCFFFITYLVLSRKNFSTAMAGSIITWFIFALVAYILAPKSLLFSSLIWLTLTTISINWVRKNINIGNKNISIKIENSSMWLKALMGGSIVSLVVLISKVAGPTWGGIFATFPAITISTLIVSNKSGGLEFTRLIAKNTHISNTTTLGLFAILSYYLFPRLGVVLGTVTSYILMLALSIPLYKMFEKLKTYRSS